MKGLKLKWGAGRLRRTALTVGVAGATVGSMLLLAAPAGAVVGTDPTLGTVILSPTSGTSATTTTWTTIDGCPTGFQSSAVLEEVNLNSAGTAISSPMTFTAVSAPFNLTGSNPVTSQPLIEDVPDLLSAANVQPSGSTEWVLKCSSVPSGLGQVGTTAVLWQDIDVNLGADGASYTVSTPAQAVSTTTTMSASPNPAAEGASVTLSATVTGTGNPAGTVTFFNGASVINSTPATVTYSGNTGTATFTLTGGFTTAGNQSLSATFTPSNTTAFNGSSGTTTESVISSGTTIAGAVPVSVTIAPTGSFTVQIPTATAVLTPNSGNTQATGNLGTVTVSDTRNNYPGFAVYGQETSNFAGSGLPAGVAITSIPSDDLGWAPAGTVEGGATLGSPAADIGVTAGPGVLVQALAGSGFGTDTLNPALTLTLPAGTPTGTFTGAVTITYIETAP
jgi:hypothetical protein